MRGHRKYELEYGLRLPVTADGYDTFSKRILRKTKACFYQPYTCTVVIFMANDIGGKRSKADGVGACG
jgi:hypothetical protein